MDNPPLWRKGCVDDSQWGGPVLWMTVVCGGLVDSSARPALHIEGPIRSEYAVWGRERRCTAGIKG